jgi:hypothetical protein
MVVAAVGGDGRWTGYVSHSAGQGGWCMVQLCVDRSWVVVSGGWAPGMARHLDETELRGCWGSVTFRLVE